MQIEIRKAKDTDIVWLLGQLQEFSRFYGTKIPVFGEVQSAHWVVSQLIQHHLVFIAEDKDMGSVGFIAGYIAPHPYNPKIRTLSEAFWWVEESSRGGRAGLLLLNSFTDWGKENADWVLMTLEHHSPVNEKSLIKRGFKPCERSYLMEVV